MQFAVSACEAYIWFYAQPQALTVTQIQESHQLMGKYHPLNTIYFTHT